MVLLCQLQDKFTGNYQRLLVGQRNGLTGLDGMDGRRESGKAYHSRQYHVDRAGLHNFVEGLLAGIDLHVGQVAHQLLQFVQPLFVGYDDGSRFELVSLLCQQFYLVVGSQTVYLVHVAMLLDDLKSLCAY